MRDNDGGCGPTLCNVIVMLQSVLQSIVISVCALQMVNAGKWLSRGRSRKPYHCFHNFATILSMPMCIFFQYSTVFLLVVSARYHYA